MTTVTKARHNCQNNLSTTSRNSVHKSHFFIKGPETHRSLLLFGYCSIVTFWLHYVFICYNKGFLTTKMLHPRRKTGVILHPYLPIMATFLCPQFGLYGQVWLFLFCIGILNIFCINLIFSTYLLNVFSRRHLITFKKSLRARWRNEPKVNYF